MSIEQVNMTDIDDSIAIQQGDAQAWRFALARCVPQLYGLFVRRGANPGLAEELTQKTVFDAIKGRMSYEPARGTVEQWIFTIARNNLAYEMRQRQSKNNDKSKYPFYD